MMEAEGIAQRAKQRDARTPYRGERDAPEGAVTVLPDDEAVTFRERAIANAQRLAGGSRAGR